MFEQFAIAAVACAAGITAGFFVFRLRYRRGLGLLAARETALKHREVEFDTIRTMRSKTAQSEKEQLTALNELLREEIEEKSMEIGFLREEHALEMSVLKRDLELAKHGAPGLPTDIEDASITTEVDANMEDALIMTEVDANMEDDSITTEAHAKTEGASISTGDDAEAPELVFEPTEGDRLQTKEEQFPNPAEPNGRNGADESERPEESPLIVAWATDIFSYLVGDFLGRPEREVEPKPEPPESARAPEDGPVPRRTEHFRRSPAGFDAAASESVFARQLARDLEQPSAPIYPRFRSLFDLLALTETIGDVEDAVAPGRTGEPDGQSGDGMQAERSADAERVGLQVLLGLDDSEFRALTDMGFTSYEKIAELSSADVRRLSERFCVPEAHIQQYWITGAQLRLFKGR